LLGTYLLKLSRKTDSLPINLNYFKIMKKAFSLVEISLVVLIIGLLIAGISSGADLYQDYRLSTARSLTTNSKVGRIPGLILWLDSTSPQSFDKSEAKINNNITNWYDINPSSNYKINFIQNIANSKPTLKISRESNLPTIYFDGNDYMQSAKTFNNYDLTKQGDVTIFIVTEIASSSQHAILFKFETHWTNRFNLQFANNLRFDYPNDTSGKLEGPANSLVRDKNLIITAIADKINQSIYVNKVLNASKANNASIQPVTANFLIGAHTNFGMNPTCNFSEIILYDRALRPSEIDDVEQYLSKKWGIKIN